MVMWVQSSSRAADSIQTSEGRRERDGGMMREQMSQEGRKGHGEVPASVNVFGLKEAAAGDVGGDGGRRRRCDGDIVCMWKLREEEAASA